MAHVPQAVKALRLALEPPSSGRKLAAKILAKTGQSVSQTTLCQLANRVILSPRASTRGPLNKVLRTTDEDWT